MVGIKLKRSTQDERLIEAIFQTNIPTAEGQTAYGSTQHNLIVDARSTANAMANRAMGAGTEHMENYKNCQKQHMGIDNIHVMRESLASMVDGRLVNVRIFVGDSKVEARPLGVFFLCGYDYINVKFFLNSISPYYPLFLRLKIALPCQ